MCSLQEIADHTERSARYCCSRQLPCSEAGCTVIAESPWAACSGHRAKLELERWEKAERAPWDGVVMLCSRAFDEYFEDPDALEDWLTANDRTLDEAHVVLCRPEVAREFVASEWMSDQVPDEADGAPSSPALEEAERALNKALADLGPLSWCPSEVAWDGTVQRKAVPS